MTPLTQQQANFIVSADANSKLPENFRLFETEQVTLVASGQPSVAALESMHGPTLADTHVINLREEFNFFVNGAAITQFTGAENDAAVGLSPLEVLQRENELLKQAREQGSVTILSERIKSKVGTQQIFTFGKSETVQVTDVQTESDCVNALKGHYTRIFVTDNNAQAMVRQVDAIVNAVLYSLRVGHKIIHVHCHQGMGRATMGLLIAACLLNAKTRSLDEIRGFFDNRDIYEFEQSKMDRNERFFTLFHQYCRESDPHQLSWSAWATQKGELEPLLASLPSSKATKNKKKPPQLP